MFRGGAAHPGAFDGVAVPRFGGLQWRVQTGGPVRSSPVVAAGVVFVGSSDGALHAIDAATGIVRWRRELGSSISSTPAVAPELVYVTGGDGVLHAIRRASGAVAWQYRTGAERPLVWGLESGLLFDSSPTLAGESVVFGTRDGMVHAVEARTGRPRWRYQTGSRVYSSPAVADGVVYVGGQDGRVHAVSLADGTARWTFATAGAALRSADFGFDRTTVQSSPSVAGGAVYVGARDGFLYSLDAATGRERWRFDHKVSWVNSSPAVDGGVVFAASSDGHFVQAVDAASGRELWRAPTTGVVWGSPTVDQELVYVGEGNGTLHALDRRNGATRWRWRSGLRIISSVTLERGRLYVGSDDGGVYAINAAEGPALHRAVFWDSAALKVPLVNDRRALRTYLAERDFTVLDATALAAFMSARVRDHEPSVVVFALDHVPSSVAPVAADTVLFRRYLDAGGTVVWCGVPPLLARAGMTGLKDLDRAAPAALLGVTFTRSNFDPVAVTQVSEEGRRLGLPPWWLDAWGADVTGLTRILARDELGQAAAWVKSYGGPPGSGFIRAFASEGGAGRPFSFVALQTLAELRPAER